ncbi:MAG: response regulator [Desulfobacterales bacterium]|nr:response regulator [Desulfobacterales bacterium]
MNNLNDKTTLLVVDDTQSDRFLMVSLLEQSGYNTVSAESGASAMEILKKTSVDLILSDQVMPEMDGIDLLRQVRKSSNIPFILLTSHGSFDKAIMAGQEGADDYLAKPFNIAYADLRHCRRSNPADAAETGA